MSFKYKLAKLTMLAILIGTSLGLGSAAVDAQGYDRRIRINNFTSEPLRELYASNVGTDDWEEDIFGNGILRPGGSVVVDLYDGSGYCKFDLKAVFSSGEVVVKRRVNICEVSSWTIYDNALTYSRW